MGFEMIYELIYYKKEKLGQEEIHFSLRNS